MDLDDILDDERAEENNDGDQDLWLQVEFDHERSLISEKTTHNVFSVERNYVNSKEYHDKFEKLLVSKQLQEALYMQAGRLLEFVDSLSEEKMGQERLVAVNFRTGAFIVDNFDRDGDINRTTFIGEELKLVNECPDSIALIHNHSKSDIPSAQDLLSYLHNEKVKLSLIACHNGDVYAIYGVKPVFEERYNDLLKQAKLKTTKSEIAKRQATTEIYLLNNDLSERHKFFNVVKL